MGDKEFRRDLKMSREINRITQLLQQGKAGDPDSMNQAMKLLYADLSRMASKHLRHRYGNQLDGATLEPAALVNETYFKLISQRNSYDNTAHFFAVATRLMLRVLADYERGKHRLKRGGDQVRVTLSWAHADPLAQSDLKVDEISSALEELETHDSRSAETAARKLIWGMTTDEIAESMSLSRRTVERNWTFARAWLEDSLGSSNQ